MSKENHTQPIPLKPDTEQFTDKQWQSVFDGGDNLLISASAGSGKTTVLVRRVIEKLKAGTDIDSLLIVTFTEAAAREMKERIQSAIQDALAKESDPQKQAHYARQLTLLPSANISTLHAFCLTVIRRYYYLIGIDPVFRMLTDETETLLLKEEVWETLREEWYASGDPLFYQLVENFSNDRSDEGLTDLVMRLYLFAVASPNPSQWLQDLVVNYQSTTDLASNPLYQNQLKPQLAATLTLGLSDYRQAWEQAEQTADFHNYLEKLEPEINQAKRLKQALEADDVAAFYLQLSSLDLSARLMPKRNENKEASQELLALRKSGRELILSLREVMPYAPEKALELMEQAAPLVECLSELTGQFLAAYRQRKLEKGLLDFNDLEHFTLAILQGDDTQQVAATYYRQRFVEVMVDEYQDVNRLQEAILYYVRQVSPEEDQPGNLFMVGDVKQSIYAFRLADPTLFIDKYLAFAEENGGRRIVLAENFRSRHEVLDFTNLVFKQLMDQAVGQIPYDEAAALIPAFPAFPEVEGFDTELLLYETDSAEEVGLVENKTQGELLMVATKIAQLVQAGFLIYDKKEKRQRPVTYRDIVLLTPTKKNNDAIIESFQILQIPLEISDGENYFQTTEIQTMIALLTIIDNPDNDIPLASVLRSPMVGLTEPELAMIRSQNKEGSFFEALLAYSQAGEAELQEKVITFLDQLDLWRDFSKNRSLTELIWRLYDDTGYLDYCLGQAMGRQRYANLLALVDRAQTYENSSFRGLYKFIRMVEKMQEKQVDLAMPLSAPVENAVRAMTIHGSKGLEFPLVFVLDMSRDMSQQDFRPRYLFEENLGAGIKYVDQEQQVEYETLPYQAILQIRRQKAFSEEMRKLYVALTRAEQKLYLVGSYKNQEDAQKKWQAASNQTELVLNPTLRMQASGVLMNWIGRTLWRHPKMAQYFPDAADRSYTVNDGANFEIRFYQEKDLADQVTLLKERLVPESEETVQQRQVVLEQEAEFQEVKKQLDYVYPHPKATLTTGYQSVSEIKRLFDDPDNSEDNQLEWRSAQEQAQTRYRFTESELARPRFWEEAAISGREIGSATHQLLQLWPMKQIATLEALTAFGKTLVAKGVLSEELAQKVDYEGIHWFLTSELGRLFQEHAGHLHREQPFAMLKEAQSIFKDYDETRDELLIHGIIDGYLELSDHIVLYDFKTDYVPHGEDNKMLERYQGQLTLYKQALEEALNKPVTEVYLVWLTERRVLSL